MFGCAYFRIWLCNIIILGKKIWAYRADKLEVEELPDGWWSVITGGASLSTSLQKKKKKSIILCFYLILKFFFYILAYYCVLKYDLNDNIMNVMMCKEIKKSLYGDKKAPSLFSSFGHILLLGLRSRRPQLNDLASRQQKVPDSLEKP